MTNFKEKKCIIFDLGNVLIDIDLNITYQRLNELGYKNNGDFISLYKQSGVFEDMELGRINADEFISELKKQLHCDTSDQQVINAWNALLLDYNPKRIETILKLKEHFKVYVLSNTNILHIGACANKVPIIGSLDKLFHKVFYSYEMGMSKPNDNIFKAVLEDIKFKPEEILFLDDSKANVSTARKLGIESWLIEYPDQWLSMFDEVLQEV